MEKDKDWLDYCQRRGEEKAKTDELSEKPNKKK